MKTSEMSLNIEDPEAHRLAAAISESTAETIAHVVIEALRQQYERLQRNESKASVAELLEIAKRVTAGKTGPWLDHAEFLYDEHGLPK